jgi:CheY-like chemotaxis protein
VEQDLRSTFLVLEDDANDAMLIRRAFINADCRAFVCRNTSEARAYLLGAGMYGDRDKFPFPDVFVTDLRLGDESGLQFFGWVRRQPELKDLPVVVLSGAASPRDINLARQLGASRILQKPADPIDMQLLVLNLSQELCRPERAYDGHSHLEHVAMAH